MKKIPIGRRRIVVCLEGWYYIFVLSFIAGAAILRRANLLLILAALLTAPLIFNWRFVYSTLKQLFFSRHVPPFVEAGELFDVEVAVENRRTQLDGWSIQIEEQIKSSDDENVERVLMTIDKVQSNNSAKATYQCLMMQRGVYEFGKLTASTSFPSGLVKAYSVVDLPQKVYVSPRLGTLTMQWKNWLVDDEVDEPRSIGGKGNEDGAFHAIREYRTGDSRRSIHWRSTAKLGKPAVKQFERQADQEINLVLDLASNATVSNDTDSKLTAGGDGDRAAAQESIPTEFCLSFFATIVDQICKAECCEMNVLLLGSFFKPFRGPASRQIQTDISRALAEIDVTVLDSVMLELNRFVNSGSLVAPLFVVSTRAAIAENLLAPVRVSGVVIQRFCISGKNGQSQVVYWLNVAGQNVEGLFRLGNNRNSGLPLNRSEPITSSARSEARP